MAKIKFTKNELKSQKDNLARFTRYLPTLALKKMQLIAETRRIQGEIAEIQQQFERVEQDVAQWVSLFAEDIDLHDFFSVKEVKTAEDSIAGIDIPVFESVDFDDVDYDLFHTPLWVDRGVQVTKEQISRRLEMDVLRQQEKILQEELRVTVQRMKLFEEVKIPEAKENIRVLQIFLGDQQTAAVVRGKIAKTKIERKKQKALQT